MPDHPPRPDDRADAPRGFPDPLEVVLDRMSDGIVSLDRDWCYRYLNAEASRLLGRPHGSLLGKHIWTEFPDGIGQPFHLAYEQAMESGEMLAIAEYYPAFERWFENRIYPSADGLTIYFRDITQQRREQDALGQSEERLRLALRAAQQGLYDLDLRTGIAVVTPEYATMLGYDPATFCETNAAWLERLHPDDHARTAAAYQAYVDGRSDDYRVEFRQRTASGGWHWVLSVGSIVERQSDGTPVRMLGTHTDIAALKLSELALADFKAVLDSTIDSVFIFDTETLRFQYVNEGARAQVGYTEDELLRLTPLDLTPDFDEASFRALLAPLVSGEQRQATFATRHRLKQGSFLPVEAVVQYVARVGFPPRFVAIVRDMSERTAAESAMRASELNLETTLRSIGDAVITTDARGRVTQLNGTAEKMTGWAAADAIGRPVQEVFRIVDSATRTMSMDPVRQVLETGAIVGLANHTSLLARNGSEYQISDSAAPIRGADGVVTGVVLVFSDVSVQYRTQAALAASERRLRAIIQQEPECVKVVDARGALLEMNPAGLAMLEADSLAQARDTGLLQFLLPEHRNAFAALHRTVIAGGHGVLEFEVKGLRGTRRWLETHAAPLVEQEGGVTMLLGVTRDITERKRAEEERRQLDLRLRTAERLEAVGQLAGGVAHDFNNLLSIINNTADLAAEELPPGSAARVDLEEIRRAGERAAALTTQLLAMSREQSAAPELLDLNTLVHELTPMLARLVREDVDLSVDPCGETCMTRVDRSLLERVLVNLVINARDAVSRGGRIRIRTAALRLGTEGASLLPALAPGDYLRLDVEDNGEGMSPETIARVFEPFFTTKARGHGTGLGLSSAYGTVAQSGGAIGVTSALGSGATFHVYLPRASASRESPSRGSPARGSAALLMPGGDETILVVDDEPALVRVAERMLTGVGYTTLSATGGEAALRLVETLKTPIHLLLTDVVMPGLSGPQLAQRVVELHPETRVLFVSGYANDPLLELESAARPNALVTKPYSGLTLLTRVRDVLDAGREPGSLPTDTLQG